MKYKRQIDSELRKIARNIPYNRAIIKCANVFQKISFHLASGPEEVVHRRIIIKGYRGLKFAVDIFEPSDISGKPPCLQMLVYPLTDITMQTDSMKKFSDTPLWNSKNNRRMWSYYVKKLKGKEMYSASPMHSGLPQIIPDAYIETAEYDCLHDEGIIYGEKLQKAGANVEINETRGTIHGYDSAIHAKITIHNIERRVSFLKRGFNRASKREHI